MQKQDEEILSHYYFLRLTDRVKAMLAGLSKVNTKTPLSLDEVNKFNENVEKIGSHFNDLQRVLTANPFKIPEPIKKGPLTPAIFSGKRSFDLTVEMPMKKAKYEDLSAELIALLEEKIRKDEDPSIDLDKLCAQFKVEANKVLEWVQINKTEIKKNKLAQLP